MTTTIQVPNGHSWEQPTGLFINGEFVPSVKGETIDVEDPGRGEVICTVSAAGPEDIDLAVAAAKKAFEETWGPLSGVKKSEILHKVADLMEKNAGHLADLEALESGKPRDSNAMGDVMHSVDVFKYYSALAINAGDGKLIDTESTKLTYTRREPYGVCGAVIAWNFPVSTFAWKVAPCLAAGNTVVVKTSELTPLCGLYLAQLFKEAGVPDGVLNVTCGFGASAGAPLAAHKDVMKISFTGSTGVGKLIQKGASENLKACTLECGGKSPLVVYDDADLDQAVKWAALGIFFNKGEVCVASSRVYVQDTIYDKFLAAFKEYTSTFTQGDQFTEGVSVGPQVSGPQYKKILGYIESGISEGAKLIAGGKAATVKGKESGYYIEPTILADCNQDMKVIKEEIFGPVVAVSKFTTDEDAIKLSNDSNYGLAAYVFTTTIVRAQRYISAVESGQVYVNSTFSVDYRVPFGGYKMSGTGRELGEAGLEAFQQVKAVHINFDGRL